MKQRKGNNRGRSGKGGRPQGEFSGSSKFANNTTRFRCVVPTYSIQSSSSTPANGGLTKNLGGGSIGPHAILEAVDPFAVGGRFLEIMQLFQRYKVIGGSLRYRPSSATGGAVQNVGAAASATYAVREFTMGFARDPFLVPGDYNEAVEAGCTVGVSDKKAVAKIPACSWCFAELPGGPTIADVRQCMFGVVFWYFPTNSTSATIQDLGFLDVELDVLVANPRFTVLNRVVAATPEGILASILKRENERKSLAASGTVEPDGSNQQLGPSLDQLGYDEKELHSSRPLDDEDWEVASAIALSMGKTQPAKPRAGGQPASFSTRKVEEGRRGKPG